LAGIRFEPRKLPTDRDTAIDYAHTLRDLSDVHFPDAAKILLVQDNLNTHKPASLYEAAFVANMEDVLEVYQSPHDPQRPLVCLNETSKQLIIETRAPIPAKPGRKARHDYEYERCRAEGRSTKGVHRYWPRHERKRGRDPTFSLRW
jgi:hypothetical protein